MSDWFETSLGHALLKQERLHCHKLLPSGYYPNSLQAGQPSLNFLDHVETGARFFVGPRALREPGESGAGKVLCALAKTSAMPFADRTHNLIVLPHTLDFCEDPHGALREVSQILIPQGCMAVTGFNSLSLWGAARLLRKGAGRAPWNGRCHRVGRVQDWLSLLGFELVGAAMINYQPPLQNENWRRKLDFLDKAGARWWPGLGAVYVIVGRKKEIAVSSLRTTRLQWRRLFPGVVQPAARVELKLVRAKR